jgi:hypothetical protein
MAHNGLCARSGTHEPRVQTARDPYICSAFHDGAAIREERQVIFGDLEPQREFIYAHVPERAKTGGKMLQIERPGAVVELNGIAAAEAHRGAALSFEVAEHPGRADTAPRVWFPSAHLPTRAFPNIERLDAAGEVRPTDDQAQGGYDLQRGYGSGGGSEHAIDIARGLDAGRWFGIDAGEARAASG